MCVSVSDQRNNKEKRLLPTSLLRDTGAQQSLKGEGVISFWKIHENVFLFWINCATVAEIQKE